MPTMTPRLILGGTLAAISLFLAAPANATMWKNYKDERYCLATSGGGTGNGTNMILYTCDSNAQDQQWTETDMGGGYVQLHNSKSGTCAGVAAGSTSNGAQLVIWTCGGTDQVWLPGNLGTDSNGHDCYDFVNKKVQDTLGLTRVFGASSGTMAVGTKIILWDWFGDPIHFDQYWCAY